MAEHASLITQHPSLRRLVGQVAVVTGAGTGIGRAAALAFAAEGAHVALFGRRAGPLEEVAREIRRALGSGGALMNQGPTPGTRGEGATSEESAASDRGATADQAVTPQPDSPLVVAGDVSVPADVDALFSAVLARWGRVDVLLNNAGINTTHRNLRGISLDDWQQVVAVNLSGSFYCARRALEPMRRQRSGTIINLVSGAGRRASTLSGVAYSAAKAGQASLTESINAEERAFNIRACSIFPGEVDTPIIDLRPVVPSAEARATMLHPEDVAAAIVLVATLPPRATIEEIVIR